MDANNTELDELFNLVKERLTKTHGDTPVKLWFGDIEFLSLDDKEAHFVTPLQMKKDAIVTHFLPEMQTIFEELVGYPVSINISVKGKEEMIFDGDVLHRFENGEDMPKNFPTDFRSEYTFENFIIGATNRLATAAATAVATRDIDKQEPHYNPLFIYGPSGVGKTHLLYAITNRITQLNPKKKIIYVKGEEFTNQMIEALKNKTNMEFRDKYRHADVLLIDDIHFVAGKVSTQEELFNTFNALYEDKKQIILTSDRPPYEIKTLEDRLRTRFMAGLITDIQLPDYDLRLAILKQKAQMNNLTLSEDVFMFIADNISASVRQLEGVIKKLGAMQLLEGGYIDIPRVENSIKEFIVPKESDTKKMDMIFNAVTSHFNVTKEDILSEKRNKEILIPRHVVAYLAGRLTTLNHKQIGKELRRDRTTIINSQNMMGEVMKTNDNIAVTVRDLLRELEES